MQPLLNIAVTAARQAGEIITRNMDRIDRLKITEKAEQDFFCEVDVKAEQAIIQTIHKAYPDHGIIAEESGVQIDDAEVVWIIDPLDGTTNYLRGFPFFSVSIAARIKNRIEHAVVYDPLRHECFSASRGRGAQLNDRRIRISKQTRIEAALLGTGFRNRNPSITGQYMPAMERISMHCAGLRRTGSSALDLAYVACGRLDGFFDFGLRPWDIAAGTLLVREAGGLVGDPRGEENHMKSGDIVVGAPKIFKAMVQALQSLENKGGATLV